MAQVRRIIDNVELTAPFSFTHQGITGQIVVDDLGDGNQIYFKYGVNTDITNDVVEVVTHVSMADFYSLSLTSVDPEGVDPDAPTPTLESTRIPVFRDNPSKTFITSGTYAGETRIHLFIDNNEEGFPVEFSTFFHGSLTPITGGYRPNTWATITRETDGSYYLILPSDDTVPAIVQPFWARFVGNTQDSFGCYLTFRTDEGNPDDEDPPTGTYAIGTASVVDATARGFDLAWTVWGGYSGKDLNRPDSRPDSKTYYTEQSAITGSGRDDYRDQGPFYMYYTAMQTIGVPIGVSGPPFHVEEPRLANVAWQMDETIMRMCNEYLIRSGFQCWNFTYYPNTYQLAHMRQLWEALSSTHKRGVKAFYSLHNMGGSRGGYRVNGQIDLTNDYTININHIVSMMGQSWYKKIDGKPVVVYFNGSESENAIDAQNLREAYKLANVGSPDLPFYEIHMVYLADRSNDFIVNNNMQAKTWYYQTNDNAGSDHSLESSLLDSYNNFVEMGNNNTSRDIVPSLNVALDGRARWEYLQDDISRDNGIANTPSSGSGINWAYYGKYYTYRSNSYYNEATSTDVTSIVNKFAALKTLFGSRMKLALVSTWDENSEGGRSTGMPKLNLDGTTINDDVIEWFKSHYNSGYTYP